MDDTREREPEYKVPLSSDNDYIANRAIGDIKTLYLTQVQIPSVPSLDTIANQPVWVALVFIVILIVVLFGGGGFLILQGLLKVVTTMQADASASVKRIDEATAAVENVKTTFTPALMNVSTTNEKVSSALDSLQKTNIAITGQMSQIAEDNKTHNKELLTSYIQTTKDVMDASNQSGLKILTRINEIDKATTDLLNAKLDSLDAKLTALLDNAPTKELKEEIAQLKLTVAAIPAALEECLKQNAQNGIDADISDKKISDQQHHIDALEHPIVLSPVDGEVNRQAIDAKKATDELKAAS